MGHRGRQALIVAAAFAGVVGCDTMRPVLPVRSGPELRVPAPVGEITAHVHPHIARYDAFEVAVVRPGGDTTATVRDAFRETLYAGLLERRYSPLDPSYVDAAGSAVGVPGLTFPLRSSVTAVRRASDGGVQVSGWVGLVAPAEAGGDEVTLYLAEVTDLAVPPVAGTGQKDGGAETGRRLAEALLRKLPAR